ncbi:MAG: hypothetical protein HXY40_10015 [Chloroflexi bacterium]|nr:hypothetical protein [Chloroflexota bacterium]
MTARICLFLVGLLLGVLQTGLFFQLTFTLSSGFGIYLLVTLAWLAGSALGVFWGARWSMRLALLAALAAYGLCSLAVNLRAFETQYWPLYALLIMTIGIYPGIFFARMAKIYSASQLFFWENNGFIGGLVLGTLLFMLLGRLVLWLAPLLLAFIVLIVVDSPAADSARTPPS